MALFYGAWLPPWRPGFDSRRDMSVLGSLVWDKDYIGQVSSYGDPERTQTCKYAYWCLGSWQMLASAIRPILYNSAVMCVHVCLCNTCLGGVMLWEFSTGCVNRERESRTRIGSDATFFGDSLSNLVVDDNFRISNNLGLGLAANISTALAIQPDRDRE